MKQRVEVLAPAGDFITLQAAIEAGADAVYVGGEKFGARAYAKNFTTEELLEAIDYVHLRGKRLYLTVNTLIKEREFDDLYDYLLPFYVRGLDAVIVQDVGVMDYVMKQFPGLGIHASTQMTITNYRSAKHLESLGVERVVPARELSLKEVREIHKATNLEIECFVHGALCYCYSGQCLLSSMIGGRSGNRGQCAQPCRLSYKVNGDKKPVDILSLKDLCTIQMIPDLIEAGIYSFKIEGRMKQPYYVQLVTRMYRKYVDLYLQKGRKEFHVSQADLRELQNAFQRRGYTDGYYKRHNGKEMLSLSRPNQEMHSEWKLDIKRKEKINGYLIIIKGENVTLNLNYDDVYISVMGPVPELATKQPMGVDRIEKQMKKTGNTPFVFDDLQICMDDDIFLPIQAINELRRQGLEELSGEILKQYHRESVGRLKIIKSQTEKENHNSDDHKCIITVSVESLDQLEVISRCSRIERVYVEDTLWLDYPEKVMSFVTKLQNQKKKVYFAMSRIFRHEAVKVYDSKIRGLLDVFDGVLVRNQESYLYLMEHSCEIPIVTDYTVYQWNESAKSWWSEKNIQGSTAPLELNYGELRELGIQNVELVVYGYAPVMVSAGCIRKHSEQCVHKTGYTSLTDRYNKKNLVKCECNYCYNVIYNSVPTVIFDCKSDLERLNPSSIRLQFTVESKKDTEQVLKEFENMYYGNETIESSKLDYTRGHFRRGVK